MATNPTITELAQHSQKAAREMSLADTKAKNQGLTNAAQALRDCASTILSANEKDIASGRENGIAQNLIERLTLTQDRISAMAGGLEKVVELEDPVGEILYKTERPNGLKVKQIRVPLGVVAIIYESRPNVTSDSAGLCIKSSNAAFLRGSGSAINSNIAIEECMREAISAAGLPADAILLVRDTDHEAAIEFMQLRQYIDCLIPRGGPNLINSILQNATVPYIIDGDGNCHVYVDATADLDMADEVLLNAKTHRTSVCNAAESLVLHKDIASEFLPRAVKSLVGVELVGDSAAQKISPEIAPATDEDYSKEYLEMKMSVKIVDSLQQAIEHINQHNSGHSEAILTQDDSVAEEFIRGVDSGNIVINASTRFIDGEELGFGAEIGISTQKLHARGPMGLKELTSTKYVVHGDGHIRN